jgi:hypothetical protein
MKQGPVPAIVMMRSCVSGEFLACQGFRMVMSGHSPLAVRLQRYLTIRVRPRGLVIVSVTTPSAAEPQALDTLQGLAAERIYRLRRFKVHLTGFVLGLPVLGAVWVLSEYFEEHTWPRRFASAPDVAGTWDPWFFFAAGIWLIILVIHALRAYLGPPVGPWGRYTAAPSRRRNSIARSSG